MKFSTKAIHVGQEADKATGATIVPIYQTSTFTYDELGVNKGYDYTRSGNPTRAALETNLAALEEGKHGLAFSSGLAAATAVLSLLKPGDHIISSDDVYGGTYRLFDKIFSPLGVSTSFIDGADLEAITAAITPQTRIIWVETPTNPLLKITDIEAISKIAKENGILLAVDNTFATPYLQRPLTLGADIVVHSTTKYINGHSDVVGGAVIVNDDELFERIQFYQNSTGAILSPFDSWLTLRGLKTLSVRMEKHNSNARAIAKALQNHPQVKKVYYPEFSEQRDIVEKQMSGFGGMISFEIEGGEDEVKDFFKNLKIFSLAESLGGVESLISYPAAMTHASIPREERIARGISDSLIRISTGIEDPEDLIEDITNALSKIRLLSK